MNYHGDYQKVLVITRARAPHGRYWHSSDVKHEGCTKEAHVITNLLHEQLAKDLFPCCVPQRETRLIGKAYHAASLLGRALKERAAWFQNLLGPKAELDCLQDQDQVTTDP